jgi:hypothetical protein
VVAPATLKQYATGAGNADKLAVFASAMHAWPEAQFRSTDTADALWLAAMGAHYSGAPIHTALVRQYGVLHAKHSTRGKRGQPKIRWPGLPAGVAPEQPALALD